MEFSLSFTSKIDETAAASQFVAATPHYLESWGDYEMKAGHFALAQPTIRPLFDTQQFQDVLLRLRGQNTKYYEVIKAHWNETVLGSSSWSKALHDGCFSTSTSRQNKAADFSGLECCIAKNSYISRNEFGAYIPKQEWEMVSKQITHGYKNFQIQSHE